MSETKKIYSQPSTETLTGREEKMLKIYCFVKGIGINQLRLHLVRSFIKNNKSLFDNIEKLVILEDKKSKEREIEKVFE